MECLANKITPKIINIIGKKGIIMAKGIIRSENKPEKIPRGIINTKANIIDINRNTSFIGIVKIYKPADNNLTKITIPKTIKRTENISI